MQPGPERMGMCASDLLATCARQAGTNWTITFPTMTSKEGLGTSTVSSV